MGLFLSFDCTMWSGSRKFCDYHFLHECTIDTPTCHFILKKVEKKLSPLSLQYLSCNPGASFCISEGMVVVL